MALRKNRLALLLRGSRERERERESDLVWSFVSWGSARSSKCERWVNPVRAYSEDINDESNKVVERVTSCLVDGGRALLSGLCLKWPSRVRYIAQYQYYRVMNWFLGV